MRTRKSNWVDMKTLKPAFGFQVFHEGRWLNAADKGKACIYQTEADRDNMQAEFRKIRAPDNAEIVRLDAAGGQSERMES